MTQRESSAGPPPGAGPSPGHGGGRIRALLAVSLAANLLVAGIVAGIFLRQLSSGGAAGEAAPGRAAEAVREMPLREFGYGLFARALPPPDQRRLARAAEQRRQELAANRRALRGQLREVLAALRDEPFDMGRLREALAGVDALVSERHRTARRLLLEHVETMDPQARAAYARRLEQLLRGRSGGATPGGRPGGG